jgi:hypothetical protein
MSKKIQHKLISELHPTQFGLGLLEVESKVKKLRNMKHSDVVYYFEDHIVPVVKGPDNKFYLIDHHHFVRACWENVGGPLQVMTRTVYDGSKLKSMAKFWTMMKKKAWVYPYDQLGKGPHDPSLLPITVRGMGDDIYRSLAWAVKEAKGFNKSDEPFFEFKWAEFFRKHISAQELRDDFSLSVKRATKLAKGKCAAKLPGFKK